MPSSPEDTGSGLPDHLVDGAVLPASLLDAVRRRRMVRAFDARGVDAAVLDDLVVAALAGPSAGNTRSLELLVLTGARVSEYWDVTLPASRRETFPWPGLLRAPVLLIPYVNPDAYVARYAEADKATTGLGRAVEAWSVPYWWVDGGAAVENVLLAVEGFALGACFFGQFEHEASVREQFGVPAERRAVGTIAVGHPDREHDRQSGSAGRPRRPIAEMTHRERW